MEERAVFGSYNSLAFDFAATIWIQRLVSEFKCFNTYSNAWNAHLENSLKKHDKLWKGSSPLQRK